MTKCPTSIFVCAFQFLFYKMTNIGSWEVSDRNFFIYCCSWLKWVKKTCYFVLFFSLGYDIKTKKNHTTLISLQQQYQKSKEDFKTLKPYTKVDYRWQTVTCNGDRLKVIFDYTHSTTHNHKWLLVTTFRLCRGGKDSST